MEPLNTNSIQSKRQVGGLKYVFGRNTLNKWKSESSEPKMIVIPEINAGWDGKNIE